jgi:5-formyltetrahydrofolate cyclo-ligase
MTKTELRQQLLEIRRRLTAEARAEKSARIWARLEALEVYRKAKSVLFFVGFGSEVVTLPMIHAAIGQGKQVAAPKIIDGEEELELRRLTAPEQELLKGQMGILEPIASCPKVNVEEIELIIVPAVGWDETGYRIGYGGGYYDRLLARARDAYTIGIGFECQVVTSLPREAHDLPVFVLVTEEKIRNF